MEPEVATTLTENGLVIVMHFFMADATGVDGGSIRILGVEHHRLINWIHLNNTINLETTAVFFFFF